MNKSPLWPKGNEAADSCAKLATKAFGPLLPFPAPLVQRRRNIRTAMEKEWTTRWSTGTGCRQSLANWPTPDHNLSKAWIKLTKQQISRNTQMLSGHNHFNYHMHILGEANDPICRLCTEDDESSIHLMDECPALAERRFEILGYIQPRGGQKSRCLSALTRFINLAWETVNGTQINFTFT